ncbi:MAG: hypothetical protein K940chlam7_00977, partial [Chlamydiae bacterium]|nr:hypothetical protein [Chlamydiota bacterium]
LEEHMDLLERLQGEVVVLSECSWAVHQERETPLSQRPTVEDEKEWSRLCDGLEQMAQRVRERGFVSAYHHHMGTVIQTKEDIDKLMQQTRTLGLLLDTGHLAYAEADPLGVLREHISRVTHVHCKSVRPSVLRQKLKEDSSFFSAVVDGVFTVPGDKEQPSSEEAIDFAQVIKTLVAADYSGWVVMEAEQDPSKADPFTYAQLGYETLHSLLTQREFQTTHF